MTDAARGRGWGTVAALGLTTVLLSVVQPMLLVLGPLALLLLALPPWRPRLLALGIALGGLAFFWLGSDPLGYIARGWTLVLGAWFVLVVVARPRAGFFSRALLAVGAAAASAAALLLATSGWAEFDWTITHRLEGAAADTLTLIGTQFGLEQWSREISSAVRRAAELQALLYPALLALASLAALAVAWWAYRRLAAGEWRPLSPLEEFRFRDELVWLLIAGVVLVLVPLVAGGGLGAAGESPAVRAGSNVLTFMGALYALRGLAVALALMGTPGLGGTLLAGVVVVLLYPLVFTGSVLVGLTDTWIDLRARGREALRSGE